MKTAVLKNRSGLVAGIVFAIGILLWMFVSKSLLIVAALGAFGPGVLRELGFLTDHDEFQRRAAYRAGYHSYLVVGLTLAIMASLLSLSGQSVKSPIELVQAILVLLWLAWAFSSLISFWGARKMTARFLMVFGAFWVVFVVASLIDGASNSDVSFWEKMHGVAFGIGLTAIFFLPAWTTTRWPRATGVALLVAATALVAFLYSDGRGEAFDWTTTLLRDSILILPLYACGIALVREKPDED